MLEGTLESFTLPDIFQLLAFTKKTGCLLLTRGSDEAGQVYFREGQVYYAVASTGRMALGKRLVGAGLVGTQQLQEALQAQDEKRSVGRALRLGQVLVDGGAIDAETLETFVREQVQDAVFDLMRWSDGAFVFATEGDVASIDEPTELSVSVENLIMEGSRRLEEWDTVRKKIPSMHAVVAMSPMPGDTGVEVSLKPEEWRLLTLVDGRRTVRELVDVFGQGEFATCRLLFGLVGAGLLEVRDVDLEGPPSIAALLQQQELLRELDGGTAPAAVAAALSVDVSSDLAEALDEVEATVDIDLDDSEADDAEVPATEPEPEPEPEPEVAVAAVEPEPLKAQVSTGATKSSSKGDPLGTDPSIDADLVRRLIEGVREL